MNKNIISLAHGNGGVNSRKLINEVFISKFRASSHNQDTHKNTPETDAAKITCSSQMMVTTDGFTVDPIFFPGGDIGKLSVCGTLNDLIVSGALPQYLTCSFLIEEGFSKKDLTLIADSMASTASDNNVQIITGDTKVLPRGDVSGVYISTTGIGKAIRPDLSTTTIESGDKVYITGSIGDHGAAVMLAREEYGLSSELQSDCESVLDVGTALMNIPEIKFMRDPTRGGVATVCHEIILDTEFGIKLIENNIPIKEEVKTFCEILGFSPYYLANEGRILFVAHKNWQPDLQFLNAHNIHMIGQIETDHRNLLLETQLGGLRIISELDDSPLPRIC